MTRQLSKKKRAAKKDLIDEIAETAALPVEQLPSQQANAVRKPFQSEEDLLLSHNTLDFGADFSSVLQNLADNVSVGGLKQQLEYLQTQQVVAEPLPPRKQARKEHALNYEAAKKDANKWMPQMSRNALAEQLRFGDIPSELRYQPTTSHLAATFKPRSTFEQQLQEAIRESAVTEDHIAEVKALPVASNVKQAADHQKLAQLRAILFREHRKNKRLGKIKSKMWRKVHRRTELAERERLLSRLEQDDPEVAARLRTEMEERRANLRMMKQQHARRRWAKVALRFGGKEMQKVVAQQAQRDRDERDAVNRIVKSAPGEALELEDDEDSDDANNADVTFDSDDEDVTTGTDAILAKAKRLAKDSATSSDSDHEAALSSGVMNMKFMREARRRERAERLQAADEFASQLDVLRKSIRRTVKDTHAAESEESSASRSDDDASSDDDRDRVKHCEFKKKPLPVIPSELLEAAATAAEQPTSLTTPSTRPTFVPILTSPPIAQGAKKDLSTSEAMTSLLASDEATAVVAETLQQENVIRDAFVVSNDTAVEFAEECKELNDDEDTQAPKKREFLPGWGSWTDGRRQLPRQQDRSSNNDKKDPASEQTPSPLPKIYINRRLDRKLAPYFVKSLPHPYNSKEQFESAQAHPLGPEWNTLQVHHRLVQPKVNIRPGSVIMPLEYAKHLPSEQLDSLLDAWSNKAKRKVPKTRL